MAKAKTARKSSKSSNSTKNAKASAKDKAKKRWSKAKVHNGGRNSKGKQYDNKPDQNGHLGVKDANGKTIQDPNLRDYKEAIKHRKQAYADRKAARLKENGNVKYKSKRARLEGERRAQERADRKEMLSRLEEIAGEHWANKKANKHRTLEGVINDGKKEAKEVIKLKDGTKVYFSGLLVEADTDITLRPYNELRARAKAQVAKDGIGKRGWLQAIDDVLMNIPYQIKLAMENFVGTPIVRARNSEIMKNLKKGDYMAVLLKGLGLEIGSLFALQNELLKQNVRAVVLDHNSNKDDPHIVSKQVGDLVELGYFKTGVPVGLFGHSTGANNVRNAALYDRRVRMYAGNKIISEGTPNPGKSISGPLYYIFKGLGADQIDLDVGSKKVGRQNGIALNQPIRDGHRTYNIMGTSSMLKPTEGVDTRGGNNIYVKYGTHFRTAGTDNTINSMYASMLRGNTSPENRSAANRFYFNNRDLANRAFERSWYKGHRDETLRLPTQMGFKIAV